MKKVLKGIGIAILIPLLLFVVLTVLLYFPPVQNWAVKHIASYASEHTGMEISVRRVHLAFPLDLGVDGVRVLRQNDSLPQVKDTVADIERTVANVQLWPLFKKQVMVDELRFEKMKINTTTLIHQARVEGRIGHMDLRAHGIDLGKERVRLNDCELSDANLSVDLSDTVPEDTTPSRNFWKINLDRFQARNTVFTLHLPGDTIRVRVAVDRFLARQGYMDLYRGTYAVGTLTWHGGSLAIDHPFEVHTKGLDFNHLALDSLMFDARKFRYGDGSLELQVQQACFQEQSGLVIQSLKGYMAMDSTQLKMPDFYFRTPESEAQIHVLMDLDAFADHHPGVLQASLHGSFGKQDLLRVMGSLPVGFRKGWPNYPLRVDGSFNGNLQRATFRGLTVVLPTAFRLRAHGRMAQILNARKRNLQVRVDAQTYRLSFLKSLLDPSLQQQFQIPDGIRLGGDFRVSGSHYSADFMLRQGGGSVQARGTFYPEGSAYQVALAAIRFPVQHFLPHQGLSPFSGKVQAKGTGFDLFSPRTRLQAKAKVVQWKYGGYDCSHIQGTAQISGGKILADITSNNPLLKGSLSINAFTHIQPIQASVTADLSRIDLHGLRISDTPLVASFCGQVDLATDRRDYLKVQSVINDISFSNDSTVYRPDGVVLDILTRRDTTHADVACGDFLFQLDGRGGYRRLLSQVNSLTKEIRRQLEARQIDQARLHRRFPTAHLRLSTGDDNFVYHLLERYGYHFKNADIDLNASPVKGVNGYVNIDSFVVKDILLDTIRSVISSDQDTIKYSLKVSNNTENPQYVFTALAAGKLTEQGSDIRGRIYDADNRMGLDVSLAALMEHNGIRFHLKDTHPVIGYKHFTANTDNYVFLGDNQRVSADLLLKASDGTGIQVFSNDSDQDVLQDLTFSLNHFDLEKVFQIIPYTPDVSGIMDGDFHVIQTKEELSVSSSLSVKNLVYEQCPMGNVGTDFVYVPKDDGSHQVNGILLNNGEEVATIDGTYRSQGEGYLDAKLGLEKTPLDLLNGFFPDQIIGLKGFGEGELTIKGALSKPVLDGEVYLDSSYLISVPYGLSMRFADDPVRIVGSHLLFENFEMFANNDSPLDISGNLDFSDLNRMMLDIRMRARNFELINAKENPRSEAYGKAFVNFFGRMSGPLDNLNMRGKLDVLGGTDMTYVLRESELTTDNELEELVKFTDFSDSVATVISRPKPQGLNMALDINIDEAAHIFCALNAEHTNYIDLEGGGDLRMNYDPVNQLRLTGKYTLGNGEMKYSLPIIPLKTFSIQNGSEIEFTGDPYNPSLNITATEKVTASVNQGTGTGRSVEFTCGVQLSKTLQNMGIQFVISAPEDVAIQDELNTMTVEERGKIAVAMLASGMYLTDGNTNKFSMNSALSSFLNSEINTIAGNAMRTLGLDLGMTVDNSTNAAGNLHTDYNFKFAKRLWNNRLSFIIGGQVSTGADLDESNRNESFFDNVELQYRLDQNASKYVRAFYNNSYYDWLEGQIGEYGVGFTWKRKLQHFKDIFNFKAESSSQAPQGRPSVRRVADRKDSVIRVKP